MGGDQPGMPSTSYLVQYSCKESQPLQQDWHHFFEHLTQHLQPWVKLSPSSEAALLEYSSGGTSAAKNHLLPMSGGRKMICRHRNGPQEVSWGFQVLWAQVLLTGAPGG